MRRRISTTILALLAIASFVYGQTEIIELTNPSFEDNPQHSRQPTGWIDCGFPGESAPDTQPNSEFAVSKPAVNGNTYLGMVVRDNETWESVTQRLPQPMQGGECYQFDIALARSEKYISQSRVTDEIVNYVTPVKLRVYGGFGHCDKRQLLAESPLVESYSWERHTFKLEPDANYTYIVLEAYYKTPILFPYNGNLLLDDASELTPLGCKEEILAVAPEPKPEEPEVAAAPQPEPKVNESPSRGSSTAIAPPKPEEKPTSFAEIRKEDLRTGQTLKIDHLYFKADEAVITTESFETLDEVYQFLLKNNDLIVEIGGHTNSLPPDYYCDELSTERAKSVAQYLMRKGIPSSRLTFRGYGKRDPIDSNDTPEGRRNNQRVELKILSMNGTSN